MTATARKLGMKNSTFKNANGLPAKGHLSTARDMSILGRHLFYDFPQYYNIFSRRTTDAGVAKVANTNRAFLDSYAGADGIKTGYTNASGFNLTASAERNGVRIIATVLGGTSTPMRTAKMKELMDIGFAKAKPGAQTVKPTPADPEDTSTLVASASDDDGMDDALPEVQDGAGKTLRVNLAMATSPRPQSRKTSLDTQVAAAGMKDDIADAVAVASGTGPDTTVAAPTPPDGTLEAQAVALANVTVTASAPQQPLQLAAVSDVRPAKRNAPIYTDSTAQLAEVAPQPEVVTRVSTSGGEHWGVNLGHYNTRSEAERLLLKIQLVESATLGDGLRKVVPRAGGYDANFVGLSRDNADLACRRLQSRAVQCFTMGPG